MQLFELCAEILLSWASASSNVQRLCAPCVYVTCTIYCTKQKLVQEISTCCKVRDSSSRVQKLVAHMQVKLMAMVYVIQYSYAHYCCKSMDQVTKMIEICVRLLHVHRTKYCTMLTTESCDCSDYSTVPPITFIVWVSVSSYSTTEKTIAIVMMEKITMPARITQPRKHPAKVQM